MNQQDLRGMRQFLSDYAEHARYGVIIYRGMELARIDERILLVPITLVV